MNFIFFVFKLEKLEKNIRMNIRIRQKILLCLKSRNFYCFCSSLKKVKKYEFHLIFLAKKAQKARISFFCKPKKLIAHEFDFLQD